MSRLIRVRADAERDAEELYNGFEDLAAGLGQRFIVELDAVYARLQENPLLYQKIYRDMRHAMLRKFPVGVFYVDLEPVVHVVAVSHLARNPSALKRRS